MSIYVCSDLHGYYSIYEQINNFILPEDTVVFLGDAVDRGPDSYKLLEAIRNNPQWIFLKGNHESMLCAALEEYLEILPKGKDKAIHLNWSYELCKTNGAVVNGRSAFLDIIENNQVEDYIQYFKSMPLLIDTGENEFGTTVVMCHAGYTPVVGVKPTKILTEDDILWDRDHIFESIKQEDFQFKIIMVHGHTPTQHIKHQVLYYKTYGNEEYPICVYKNGKIDIDAGVFVGGIAYLINASTLTKDNIEYKEFHTTEVPVYGKA